MYNFISVGYDTVIKSILKKDSNVLRSMRGAESLALIEIENLNFPDKIFLSGNSLNLGRVVNRVSSHIFKKLKDKYGEQLPYLCALANKHFHASVIAGNIFFRLGIEDKSLRDNEYTRKLCTFEGYLEIEGAAYTVYNFEASLTLIEVMKKNFEGYNCGDSMEVLGLYWINVAEEKFNNTGIVDIDLLAEAFDTFTLSNGSYMWEAGYECAKEDQSRQLSMAAKKRHTETYELKEQAIKFWRDNIDHTLSNDKAAEVLMKIVPVSFRKLSEYVSEAKRENIHSAGKK